MTADRIKQCDRDSARKTRYASEDYRGRLLAKLKGRFDHPLISCTGLAGRSLNASEGNYTFDENGGTSTLSFTNKLGDAAVSIDAKNDISYRIGHSTWSEPMAQFEKRVACQSDPQSCPRDAALPMFDDQIGTDASHPFGSYYDGSEITRAYLNLKSFYLLKQVGTQLSEETLACYELRSLVE